MLLSGVPNLAAKAVEFSSLNTTSERSAALTAFAKGEAKLLVASDAMTRGMDLPSVAAVVNYDAPVYPKPTCTGQGALPGLAGQVSRRPASQFASRLWKLGPALVLGLAAGQEADMIGLLWRV